MEIEGTARLDAQRKQMLYRASHRGIKEMDIILGGFAASRLAALSQPELAALQILMDETDRDLLSWFTGEVPCPAHVNAAMFEKIRAFQAASVA